MLSWCKAIIYIFIRKMARRTCLYILIKFLVMLLVVCVVFVFFLTDFLINFRQEVISNSSYSEKTLEIEETFRKNAKFAFTPSKCDTVHVGMVVFNSKEIMDFYTVLKSILFYRSNPLHLHILVDTKTEYILKYLLETWSISQLNVTYYKLLKNYNKTIISTFPALLSNSGIENIIIIDSDKIVMDNIYKLWNLFNNFSKTQFLGIINIEDDSIRHKSIKRNQIILVKLKDFPPKNLTLFKNLSTTTTYNSNFYYVVFCGTFTDNGNCYDSKREMFFEWNSGFSNNNHLDYAFFLKYDGSLLRKMDGHCSNNLIISDVKKEKLNFNCFEFIGNTSLNWRALLFIQDSNFSVVKNDVTLVTQLSYDRIKMVEELKILWNGPIALSLYAADFEMDSILNYIKNNLLFQNRSDIAIHIVFKENTSYPINILRNVALKNVVTEYAFLVDIDFIPSQNLYTNLRYHFSNIKNGNKRVFVVPAFETVKTTIPATKLELIRMLIQKTITPFHYDTYPAAHEPTNYTKWIVATEPYVVQWKFEYESYLVVQKNITPYDTRFFGYGWNKVSHIMELHKQSYEFVVLPNVFIVHKNHELSKQKKKLLNSINYQRCLNGMKKDFVRSINRKYKMMH